METPQNSNNYKRAIYYINMFEKWIYAENSANKSKKVTSCS
jgi:hypothetical protein